MMAVAQVINVIIIAVSYLVDSVSGILSPLEEITADFDFGFFDIFFYACCIAGSIFAGVMMTINALDH